MTKERLFQLLRERLPRELVEQVDMDELVADSWQVHALPLCAGIVTILQALLVLLDQSDGPLTRKTHELADAIFVVLDGSAPSREEFSWTDRTGEETVTAQMAEAARVRARNRAFLAEWSSEDIGLVKAWLSEVRKTKWYNEDYYSMVDERIRKYLDEDWQTRAGPHNDGA